MSKIPKFESKIRKPQDILKELPNFQNGNRRLRRSTSLETLNKADKKTHISTFPIRNQNTSSFSNLQRLNLQPKPKLPSTEDRIADLPTIKNRPGRINLRRSKSYSDLKPTSKLDLLATKTPKPGPSNSRVFTNRVTKPNLAKTTVKPNIPPKTGVKRPAEPCVTGVKKKIIKKTKVPDWDYKTRFHNLQEEHNELKSEFSSADAIILNHQAELTNLRISEQDLKKGNDELRVMYEDLKSEYNNQKKKLEEANAIISNNQVELTNLQTSEQDLKKQNDELQVRYEDLKNKYNEQKEELEEVKHKYNDSSSKYEQCSAEKAELLDKVQHLLVELYNGEQMRRKLHNTIQDLKGNIRVFCRLRPPLTDDERNNTCIFNFPDINSIEITKRRETEFTNAIKNSECQEFTFDRVFDSGATQVEVFEELSQLVQSAMDGYHICVFAYGQTGSGKTYTMQGEICSPDAKGMIPRSIELLFNKKVEMEEKGWLFKIQASFLEIYNENIRDLLDMKSGKSLNIRHNEGRGNSVPNLTVIPISTAEELLNYMHKSQQNRSTAVTNYNEHSSRSHAVTKIYIESRYQDSKEVYVGSVSLVDLAGSESAKFVSNERLAETKNINKSLSNLGNVLMALHKKETHVPYRNSKLTFLLQSSLGGNCKCLMIVNISPVIESFNESVNALRFAAKVKEVKVGSTKNKLVTPSK